MTGILQTDVERLLVGCHRRCCVCHRFCGVRMEVDHILPEVDGGPSTFDNAIALCFDCHAEVHHYNPAHPRGRRFRPSELRAHRDQWLTFCKDNPGALTTGPPPSEAGTLERLLSELIFNEELAASRRPAALFEVAQLQRAIAEGAFTWLAPAQVSSVCAAYARIAEARNRAVGLVSIVDAGRAADMAHNLAGLLYDARPIISAAVSALLRSASATNRAIWS